MVSKRIEVQIDEVVLHGVPTVGQEHLTREIGKEMARLFAVSRTTPHSDTEVAAAAAQPIGTVEGITSK